MNRKQLIVELGCLMLASVVAGAMPVLAQSKADTAATSARADSKDFRHDPFESLVTRGQSKSTGIGDAPAGIPGLVISKLQINGIVKSSHGLIAVVTNSAGRTYFLHEGVQLYDGRVEKISVDGVSFLEVARDAFGKSMERQVNKRIYSSAGEQQ
jgi:Tfp pilus assembly protein PilP